MPMKTTFSSSFTNPSFSLSFIGVDRFRLLLKGCGLKVLSLLLVVMVGGMSWGQTWTGTTSAAYFTATNWSGSLFAGSKTVTSNTDIASITTGTSNANAIGINMNFTGNTHYLGAFSISGSTATSVNISNSSTSYVTSPVINLNGATVNGINNVIIRNSSSSSAGVFTISNGGSAPLGLLLGNSTENIINIDGTAGVTITGVISGSGKNLTKSGTGAGVLTLSGVNSFSGNTTITSGTLALSGSGSISTSPIVTIGAGATFDISGRSAALTLAAGQSLRSSATGNNTTATVTVAATPTLTLSAGGLGFASYGGGTTAPMTVAGTGGSLALASSPVTVTTTTALGTGTYKLIAKSGSATVTGTPGALTMAGSGLAANTTASLSLVSGELFLTVTSSSALSAPTLTAAVSPTVDASFNVTFTDDATWRGAISGITVGGSSLASSAYDNTQSGKIVFTPSLSTLLQTAGTKSIVISATGYSDATVSQTIGVGAASSITISTQPTAPATSGATLAAQPVMTIKDQYLNVISGASVTAAVTSGQGSSWTLGGTTSVTSNGSGLATFSGLTATNATTPSAPYTATLTFSTGTISQTSSSFVIPGISPSVTAAVGVTVDAAFSMTFTDNSSWRSAITGITVGGTTMSAGYSTSTSGQIVFTPSLTNLLQTAGTKSIVISATGYPSVTVSQSIGVGAAAKLAMNVQPTAPATNGAVLATQPKVYIQDQYGNNTASTASVTASVGAGAWTIGGTTSVAASAGLVTFTNLTATSSAAVTGATITFTSGSLTSITSSAFNIVAPAPVNDLCSNAITLTPGASAISGTLTSATNSNSFSSAATLKDVWYKLTTSCSGSHLVAITYSTGADDIDFYIFTTSTCPTSGAENFSSASSTVNSESGSFVFASGTTYYIRVVNYSLNAGAFNISVSPPAQVNQAVTTNAASSITALAAVLNGNVTALGNCPPSTEKGFVYAATSSNANPMVGGSGVTKTPVSSIATGAYTLSLGSLTPGTSYSFNTYVYDGSNYTYGTAATFTTLSNPNLSVSGTTAHGSVCPNTSASSITYTISNSGADASNVVVTSSDPQFVVSNLSSTTILANGTATYNVVFTPTSAGAKSATITVFYNTSTQATTSSLSGTGTASVTGVVVTNAATSIVNTTATLNGSVTTLGVCPATSEKGFVYSVSATNADPFVGGTGVTKTAVSGLTSGAFTLALTGLSTTTNYTVKAYVFDGSTYVYGSPQTFNTLAVATKLGFGTAPGSTAYLNTNMSSFTVQAQRSDNSVDSEYAGTVTLSSTGAITGTTVTFVNGVATFSATQFTTSTGVFTITASLSPLISVTSSSISVTNAPVVIYQNTFENGTLSSPNYTGGTTSFATNLSNSTWTIASGTLQLFGGNGGGNALGVSSGSSSTPYTLTFNVANGYQVSVTSYSFWKQTSTSALVNSVIINGITVSSGATTSTTGSTGTLSVANAVSGLTGTITVVLNITGSGSFRLDDFTLTGTVSCSTPAQPSTISGNASVCAGSSQTYSVTSVSGVAYAWSLPNNITGSSSTNSISTTIGSAGSGTITVTPYNSASGCSSYTGTTRSLAVTVNALPTVTATTSQTVCNGASVTLNGGGASSYSWTGGISNNTPFNATATTSYTVTGTDANGCTNTASSTVTVNPSTNITAQPAGYTILATGTSPSALTVTASGTNLTYQWYSNTVNSTTNATLITSATNASYTPPATAGAMYYFVIIHGDCGSDVTSNLVAVVISDSYTWNGSVNTDWNTAANWTPAGVPPTTAVVSVPNCTNDPLNGSLTIASGGSVTLASGTMLTLSGIITNNGTLTIESGATLVQTGTGTNIGNGTYNVKQAVSGSGGSTPNGRFWYLGGALSDASSADLLNSTGNQLWQWNESTFSYATVASGQPLIQGKSYVLRSGQTSETINFSGAGLSNGTVTVSGLTRTGTTQTYRGCHLISNPYPSYLDWNAITKTNIGTTMYVRTASGSTLDVLETYNSANGQGTNISGPTMTQYIAPMQGFWVKVSADGQTGSLTMNNSMRSHQASGSGLRSSAIDFPAYLRFNMIDGQNKDQVILLMSPDATMSLDAFDSEKMPASGYGQFYSTVNAKKLVINGMKNVKAKTSVPLTLELPTSKSYTFQAEEFNIEDGLILLEDKQEGIIQDLTINPTYTFFNNAGTNATRFVVHLQLASEPVLVGGPQELENLGMDQLSTDNIQITSNNQGTVIVRLDEGFKPEGSIRIFDASGRLVDQRDFNDQETTIQLNEQAGMYFVEVTSGKLMVKKKIVIN
jgi:hypothetical protein